VSVLEIIEMSYEEEDTCQVIWGGGYMSECA
jgi:hypothetical protein